MKAEIFRLAAFLLALAIIIAGCNREKTDKPIEPIITYTVTFNSNGGSEVPSQTVNEYGKATEPDPAPALEGYILEGWYESNHALSKRWNFEENSITSDTILYAKWYCLSEVPCDKSLFKKWHGDPGIPEIRYAAEIN